MLVLMLLVDMCRILFGNMYNFRNYLFFFDYFKFCLFNLEDEASYRGGILKQLLTAYYLRNSQS